MAGNSVIGALRVDLGLNSAQFTEGLKKAQVSLGEFGKTAAIGLAAVATAAIAAGAALGIAVKGSIDHAAALDKASQKAGVTVEALSRLEYAAKLSDVSLEGLTGGLEKLSKSMAAVASGSGPITAFKALGISVVDVAGHLRDTNEVFADVADRFSRMEDGATKTALAIQIFGKGGAELIPLLNQGRNGLKGMADEADRLGVTISTKTAQAAEKFNVTMTKVGEAFQGIVTQLATALLPALQSFADALAKVDPATVAVIAGIAGIGSAALIAAPGVSALTAAVGKLYGSLALIAALPGGVLALAGGVFLGSTEPLNVGEDALVQKRRDAYRQAHPIAWLGSGFGTPDLGDTSFAKLIGKDTASGNGAAAAAKSLDPLQTALTETTDKVAALAKSIGDGLSNAISGFVGEIEQGTDPLKAFADQLANLGEQLLNAGIQSIIGSIFKVPLAFAPGAGFAALAPRAAGGPVSVGSPYVVGERGPELFVPGANGTIVPNGGGTGGGGQSVVRVELGPELVGKVLKQAANQSVQITKTQAPAAVARSRLDNRK